MRSKKGAELETSTVVLFVLALIILAIGVYIIYTKVLKPSDASSSIITCQGRGGTVADSCSKCAGDDICIDLVNADDKDKKLQHCCIPSPFKAKT